MVSQISVDKVREVWSCRKRDLCLEEEDGRVTNTRCVFQTIQDPRDPTLHSQKNSRN